VRKARWWKDKKNHGQNIEERGGVIFYYLSLLFIYVYLPDDV